MTTYRATFEPQAWHGDNAVPIDPAGPTSWDCTAAVAASPDYFATVLADAGLDRHDILRGDPAAPAWIREHRGPFTITVEVSA